jgi:hypothetical protein
VDKSVDTDALAVHHDLRQMEGEDRGPSPEPAGGGPLVVRRPLEQGPSAQIVEYEFVVVAVLVCHVTVPGERPVGRDGSTTDEDESSIECRGTLNTAVTRESETKSPKLGLKWI